MAKSLTIPDKQGKVRDANPLPVKIGDGTDNVDVQDQNGVGTLPVIGIDSSGNQVNPATETKQDTIITNQETTISNQTNGNQQTKVIDENSNVIKNPIRKNIEGGGKVSVGTTAVEVTFTGDTTSIIITADKDNTGILYIGESDVTNLGANAMTYLEAGDSITIDYDDTDNAVYVVSDTASQYFWKGALL